MKLLITVLFILVLVVAVYEFGTSVTHSQDQTNNQIQTWSSQQP